MVAPSTQTDFFRVQLYPAGADPLAQTRLLIPLENMLEVMTLPRQDICPVPGVAPGVLGVTNQRGQLIWVVDRRSPSGLGTSAARPNPQEKLTVVLLGQGDAGQVGFVVTQLEGIAPFDLGGRLRWRRLGRDFIPIAIANWSRGQRRDLRWPWAIYLTTYRAPRSISKF
ncbi:chemotaxis protein CheW [Picosynechococcus sp. OG1]|uniref:chemotaxis protein CheW n=1 Tax=Picosynechococcus sp. OG1 TaxID=1938863 RepID=UPI000A0F02B3|nr:chemotaxis protein CheW [Picosynechococcus sp. OG1]SMH50468.1 CheW-like domain-containing protein [Picosynechococcus sp. OG1]